MKSNGDKECPKRAKCLEILSMVLDGEATKKQQEFLNTHINECLSCLNDYKLEKQIKSMLQSSCHKVKVPDGLAESIRSKLTEKAS